jgi:hypothetical protein
VGNVAVVGKDQPVDAVAQSLPDVVLDAVFAVVAEEGVDVVVSVQPEVLSLLGALGRLGEGLGGSDRATEAPSPRTDPVFKIPRRDIPFVIRALLLCARCGGADASSGNQVPRHS